MDTHRTTRVVTRREALLTGAAAVGGVMWSRLVPRGIAQQPADRLATFRAQIAAAPIQTQQLTDNLTLLSGPGGNVVVLHSNLLTILSPQGVRSILAHEIGHIRRKDSYWKLVG